MGIYAVFKVLYSPVKAFKEIVEKPDFKGVLLILILFLSFAAIGQYVVYSKIFLLTETPDDDDWTESTSLWTSNGLLSLDDANYRAGNYSVRASVTNRTNIWMKMLDIGPFDCSENEGYETLFFWVNWTGASSISNATLRLFSESDVRYFELDITGSIANSRAEWSNATIKVGPKNQDWTTIDSPKWTNVTGVEFKLEWLTSANLTLKIDDLHFQRHVSFLEKEAIGTEAIVSFLIQAAVTFFMNWILWSLILFMVAKLFREEGGPLMRFFVIIGHVFMVFVVYMIASVAVVSLLPNLNFPLKTLPATEAEANTWNTLIEETWGPNWAYWGYLILSGLYLPFVRELWIMALCTVAIRPLLNITWGKALGISLITFVIVTLLIPAAVTLLLGSW